MQKFLEDKEGFTLIELLVVIGIIAILAGIAIVALNPGRQFSQARNSQRSSDVNAILNAVDQNIVDNRGDFECTSGAIPTSTTRMSTSSSDYDIAPCLVPDYLSEMPSDPGDDEAFWKSVDNYDTGYEIVKNATTGRITVSAPSAELGKTIEVTR